MKKEHTIYQFKQQLISVLMLVTLLWLTVSTPFVYASQLQLAKQQASLSPSSQHDDSNDDEKTCTPLGSNTAEEKPHGSINSLSEEYLHLDSELFRLAELSLNHTRYHTASEYVAFHGELLCPPPNYRG